MVKKEKKQPETLGEKILAELWDIIKIFVVTYAALSLCFHFLFRPVRVQGSSMYPTLHDQDLGIADIFFRNTKGIDRFDIVIIYLEDKNEYLVKRVIGLPNETIECKNGIITVNGEVLSEDFLNEEYVLQQTEIYGQFTGDFGPVVLAEDEYWCLGDNRPLSSDSRRYGAFTEDQIGSRLAFIFFPFDNMGSY